MENTDTSIEDVFDAISLAQKYNLVCEVVLFALLALKKNPEKSIKEVLDIAIAEWIK